MPVVAFLAACATPTSTPGSATAPAARTSLVGAPAPAFELHDPAGRPVTLEYYRGQRHIVLVFYEPRGEAGTRDRAHRGIVPERFCSSHWNALSCADHPGRLR